MAAIKDTFESDANYHPFFPVTSIIWQRSKTLLKPFSCQKYFKIPLKALSQLFLTLRKH